MKLISAQVAYIYARNNYPNFPGDWYITKNFSWNEAFKNEKKEYEYPRIEIFNNIAKSALEFQKVREYLNKPMNIHCWFRSQQHNQDLKNQGLNPATHSAHLAGMAIDYDVAGMTDSAVRAKLAELINKGKLKIRIEANTTGWVHNDIGNPYTRNYNWGVFNA